MTIDGSLIACSDRVILEHEHKPIRVSVFKAEDCRSEYIFQVCFSRQAVILEQYSLAKYQTNAVGHGRGKSPDARRYVRNAMNRAELEEFKGIDLTDSWVISWKLEADTFQIEIEASIWPESSFYTKPKPGEYTCYRAATLKFTKVKSIKGLLSMESVQADINPDGSSSYGNLYGLEKTWRGFRLVGEFGSGESETVKITGGKLSFEIHT